MYVCIACLLNSASLSTYSIRLVNRPAHQSVCQYLNNTLGRCFLIVGAAAWRKRKEKLPRLPAAYSYTCSRSSSHIKASLIIMLAYGSSMPQEGRKTRHTGSRQQTAAAAAGHLKRQVRERSASLHTRNLFLSPSQWLDKAKIFNEGLPRTVQINELSKAKSGTVHADILRVMVCEATKNDAMFYIIHVISLIR